MYSPFSNNVAKGVIHSVNLKLFSAPGLGTLKNKDFYFLNQRPEGKLNEFLHMPWVWESNSSVTNLCFCKKKKKNLCNVSGEVFVA